MNPALWISKTGLDAQQTNISVTSNNLANASTVGFKKGRAIFEDLLYQNVHQPGGRATADSNLPSGLMIGAGSKVVATQKSFTQGNVQTTDNALDVMIDGRGFFEVLLPDGTTGYTRNGQFALNDEGIIVTPGNGYPLLPEMQIPENAQSISVGTNGEVSVQLAGQAEGQVIGQIIVTDFANPAGLQPKGENLYLETQSSGAPLQGIAGADGFGNLKQGMLETSNVNVTEELVNLIQAQRVYEMNSKVISAVDDMLAYVNQQL
ncbi:flagellar basal-body rod protein FlgG [Oceanimonas baumannii]|uniref:Flagellar basal-body rod protein FlgG n=1 Tax=Oceanimonas baumannii TaxID=129578 RepID=A0A235CMV7_9GAMM|nr:flagellar basal-body rod protein FlgG [Oceanimonas baumannii]MCC4263210.1 flagellar basal-body rod protein FlgG [Oceanimonas baumannii]OYD25880.1 flagellar basal-body rod protein FlgG [Oceanimonas baumannii]TDW60104.1 flagellar basal-body rod protein FlgG [Oceanimonas baumannii]